MVLFGTLFNDIKIARLDTTHNVTGTINVPLTYGPREKVLSRVIGDPNLNKMPAIQLPRMAFELTDFQYDGGRKLHSTGRHSISSNTDIQFQYVPVPYNFMFSLSALVKNVDDGWRITEQILPFFTPEFTLRADLIPEMLDTRDIPVVLDSVRLTDLYEGSFEERRVLMVDFMFTMKAHLFGPIRTGTDIITMANTNFFDTSGYENVNDAVSNIEFAEMLSITPGQYANGQPTSNAAATIDRSLISPESDYGFVVQSNTNIQ